MAATGLAGLLGPKLVRDTEEFDTTTLKSAVVAVYFSAHWCGPCQQFTPEFAKVYRRCKQQGKSFEVVFVSSDRSETEFKSYFATMPWCAVPYADRARQQTLSTVFQIRGVPSVVLLSGSGSLLDREGRAKVMAPSFPSTLPRAIEVEADIGPLPEDPVQVVVRHQGKNFELDCMPEEGWELLRMQIFSLTEVPEEKQRLFGLGRATGLLSEDVPLPRALALALRAQRGSGLPLANVPDSARSASSALEDSFIGSKHHAGCLDSSNGWLPKPGDSNLWYQMDVGEERDVAGVAIAPRAGNHSEYITKFKVSVSTDGEKWDFVDRGAEFDFDVSWIEARRIMFASAVKARYVRIHPTANHKRVALRADVVLAGDTPDSPPVIVVLGNFSAEDPFEFRGAAAAVPQDASTKMVEEQCLAFLQAKLSALPPKCQSQVNSFQHVRVYEDIPLQTHALDQLPVLGIDCAVASDAAAAQEGYEVAFMRKLLRWFKFWFFSWTNAPQCEHCGSTDTKTVGSTQPTPIEKSFAAGAVEVAKCNACGNHTRFPRYNDPSKLLETRTGRCGEWANCFTLVCRALGYESRHVHDWTDHVWTEIYSDSLGRWLHADSCEAALDCPLMYEQGWGKKLTYVLSFGRDNVCDTSRRYSKNYADMMGRRNEFPENQLARAMAAIDDFALDSSMSRVPATAQEARRKAMATRKEAEEKEMVDRAGSQPTELKEGEQIGRTSGDKAWREQRGELGGDDAARQKAIACSESGVPPPSAAAAAVPSVPGSWGGSAETASLKDGVLTADLRRRDGSWNRGTSVRLEVGASYCNNDGNFEAEPSTTYHWGRIDSAVSDDAFKIHRAVPLPGGLQKVAVACRWTDQGFGNQKGQLALVVRRGNQEICRKDCFGSAPHTFAKEARAFSAAELSEPRAGDVLALEYRVGGGGGHKLTVEELCVVLERTLTPTATAAPAEGIAVATTECATPPAEAAPPSKEAMQALVKAAFADLVKGGMPPNEAAVKAIEQVKLQAYKPPPRT